MQRQPTANTVQAHVFIHKENALVKHQVVIGALIPDQEKNEIFVPILSFVTRHESLIKILCTGDISRGLLN
jgi:hypothetical protein